MRLPTLQSRTRLLPQAAATNATRFGSAGSGAVAAGAAAAEGTGLRLRRPRLDRSRRARLSARHHDRRAGLDRLRDVRLDRLRGLLLGRRRRDSGPRTPCRPRRDRLRFGHGDRHRSVRRRAVRAARSRLGACQHDGGARRAMSHRRPARRFRGSEHHVGTRGRSGIRGLVGGQQEGFVVPVDAGGLDIFDAHLGHARALEIEHLGGPRGDVDQPRMGERPAIVDAHDDGTLVGKVGDAHIARQRQRRMRGGERRHVEHLAVRRPPPVELTAVPGGRAHLLVARIDLRLVPLAAHLIGLADMVAPGRVGDRFGGGQRLRVAQPVLGRGARRTGREHAAETGGDRCVREREPGAHGEVTRQ